MSEFICFTNTDSSVFRIVRSHKEISYVLKKFKNPRVLSLKMSTASLEDQVGEWTTQQLVTDDNLVIFAESQMAAILQRVITSKDVLGVSLFSYKGKEEERAFFTLDTGLIISFHRVDNEVVSCKIWDGTDIESIIRYLPKGKLSRKPHLDDVSWAILAYTLYRKAAQLYFL